MDPTQEGKKIERRTSDKAESRKMKRELESLRKSVITLRMLLVTTLLLFGCIYILLQRQYCDIQDNYIKALEKSQEIMEEMERWRVQIGKENADVILTM